jgi:AraC-like DNA-binding protein
MTWRDAAPGLASPAGERASRLEASRSLLYHVDQAAINGVRDIALDTGYPDSTHFSHSIRQVYGLRPSDILAGSRRLAVHR